MWFEGREENTRGKEAQVGSKTQRWGWKAYGERQSPKTKYVGNSLRISVLHYAYLKIGETHGCSSCCKKQSVDCPALKDISPKNPRLSERGDRKNVDARK